MQPRLSRRLQDSIKARPDELVRSADNVSEPLTNSLRMSVVFIVNSLSEHEVGLCLPALTFNATTIRPIVYLCRVRLRLRELFLERT